jgi:eukaryotic-like serine/threonine-protein kinase
VAIGTLIDDGKYELVSIAGEGGMATVFKGVIRGAAGFARPVAIKRIRPEYRGIKNYIAMFVEEARVGSDLAHPNIVQVHDFCTDDGIYYLIMEWVDGMDFGAMMADYKHRGELLPWHLIVHVVIGTLRGLDAAHHRRGADGMLSPVIHRDVSPHNILISTSGTVKLSDFGLARARDRAASLTAPGTVKGKLAYLAPEVTFGKANSPQSDIFSTCIVMWEALTHQRLFDGKTDLEVFRSIRACQPPPITQFRNDVPLNVLTAMSKGLAAKPEDRFASAGDLASVLAASLAHKYQRGHDATTEIAAIVADYKLVQANATIAASLTPTDGGPELSEATHNFDVEFSSPDLQETEPILLEIPKKLR